MDEAALNASLSSIVTGLMDPEEAMASVMTLANMVDHAEGETNHVGTTTTIYDTLGGGGLLVRSDGYTALRGDHCLELLMENLRFEDNAAGESCPVWPGQPMTAHWGIEDPAAVEGPDIQKEAAFVAAFRYLKNRISVFTALPIASLDRMTLGSKIVEIGQLQGATKPRPSAA